MTLTHEPAADAQGCVQHADVFQHSLLEDPPTAPRAATRRKSAELLQQAEKICTSCPLMQTCLYNAVVEHDVAGVAAGTTAKQRQRMRELLGWKVEPENLDTMAGTTAQNRQVDHDEVVRLRQANPHETLDTLANRLGCSLSTIKRHLRRHRLERTTPRPVTEPAKPTMHQVHLVHQQLAGRGGGQLAA